MDYLDDLDDLDATPEVNDILTEMFPAGMPPSTTDHAIATRQCRRIFVDDESDLLLAC